MLVLTPFDLEAVLALICSTAVMLAIVTPVAHVLIVEAERALRDPRRRRSP